MATGDGRNEACIEVKGSGVWTAAPDILVTRLGVAVVRPRVQEAWSIVSARMEELMATLREAQIADEDLATDQLATSVEYDYSEDQPRLIGYRVEHVLRITVRDVTRGPSVIESAMVVAGDLAVLQGVSFEVSQQAELFDQARRRAWQDAQHRANQLASLAGVRVGPALTITEVDGPHHGGPGPVARMALVADAAMPLPGGQLRGQVDVVVRFAIQ